MGELKKLGWFYRLLCGLISSFCLIALLGVLAFGRDEGVHVKILIFVAVVGVLLYVSLVILLKGYPPRFLKWTAGRK